MAKITTAGHSLHVIINDYPIALLSTSLLFDLGYMATRREGLARTGQHLQAAGLVMGVLTAITGIAEFAVMDRREPRVRRHSNAHAVLSTAMMVLMTASYFARRRSEAPVNGRSLAYSALGNAALIATAWYGDEMVFGEGVRVRDMHFGKDVPELRPPGDKILTAILRGDAEEDSTSPARSKH